MSEERNKYIESISAIKAMRNAMIVFSFVPIVFMAVVYFSLFMLNVPSPSMIRVFWAYYGFTALCGVMVVYSIWLLLNKKLLLETITKIGLALVAVSFSIGGIASWDFGMPDFCIVLMILCYLVGLMIFVVSSSVNISLKISHILFYVVFLIGSLLGWLSSIAIAVVAIAIVVYPMVVSYVAVNWASKEFFKLNK